MHTACGSGRPRLVWGAVRYTKRRHGGGGLWTREKAGWVPSASFVVAPHMIPSWYHRSAVVPPRPHMVLRKRERES